jgi:hypothetical protein
MNNLYYRQIKREVSPQVFVVDQEMIHEPGVKVVIDKVDPYTTPEVIFTFPKLWEYDRCKKYCENRNYNPYSISINENITMRCKYSWHLSYYNQFGEWPND